MNQPEMPPCSGEVQQLEGTGFFLLFPAGERPTAAAMAELVESAQIAGQSARVSHVPDGETGCLELLTGGLTFDLSGLAPAAPARTIATQQTFGFEAPFATALHEAVELVPSEHVAAGAALMPVLRAMAGLAANLVLNLPVAAISWGPAGTLMEPRYFSNMVLNWMSGGAFPARGLTRLNASPSGGIVSHGLSHFIGQELQLEGRAGECPDDALKLAARLIDHLIRHGRVEQATRIGTGPDALLAEPSQVGNLLLVWRKR